MATDGPLIRALTASDWPMVRAIYVEGIETGNAIPRGGST
jgi:L-amino acid N-acyltransferase YncA